MKELFKLRHFDTLSSEDASKIDYATLMVDVLDYKNSLFGKTKWFVKNFSIINLLVQEVRQISTDDVVLNDSCNTKKPLTIDDISYLSMLNLQSYLDIGEFGDSISHHVSKVVAMATYGANKSINYKPDSISYTRYEESLLDKPLFDMLGLYNWVIKDLVRSRKDWDDRFFSVEVLDKDFEKHGGQDMRQFNVINTVKNLCKDFNTPEKDVWNFSYSLVMTNNYEKAFAYWIQKNIQVAKEAEIERNRNKH